MLFSLDSSNLLKYNNCVMLFIMKKFIKLIHKRKFRDGTKFK